jgi:hypothetical protein
VFALLEAGASIEEAAETLDAESIDDHPDLILADVSTEKAAEIFASLAEMGVLDWKVEERVEELAAQRLLALKQEHNLVSG